jgi:hypothetical protein
MVQLLKRLIPYTGSHEMVQFPNTIVLNVSLEMITPKMMIPKMNNWTNN